MCTSTQPWICAVIVPTDDMSILSLPEDSLSQIRYAALGCTPPAPLKCRRCTAGKESAYFEDSDVKVGREQMLGTSDCRLVNIYNGTSKKVSETRSSIEGIATELFLPTTRPSKHVTSTEAKKTRHPRN